jgi:hypothetical protein
VWFFDYDNDGWADLLVTSYNMSVAETARNYLGLPHNAGTMKLYKNLGNGAFRDVTVQMGLDKALMPMGSNFGDIDNDGYPDIYIGHRRPVLRVSGAECSIPQQGGKSLCGHHRLIRDRRDTQGTRRGFRGHR